MRKVNKTIIRKADLLIYMILGKTDTSPVHFNTVLTVIKITLDKCKIDKTITIYL